MYLFVFLNLILLIEYIYYLFQKYSQKDNKTINYYREIPSNESPAIVGLMIKKNVDGNDIIATLLDLCERGYITIEYKDDNNKIMVKDSGKDRLMTLKDYENYLLDQIFSEEDEVLLEDFINSSNFESTFKNIGNMIKKIVDLKTIHKISQKRLGAKINFIINISTLGFSLFFSFIYLFTNSFILSIIISYFINIILLLFARKAISKNEYDIESLLFALSFSGAIVYLGIIIILYLLNEYIYQINTPILIGNILIGTMQFVLLFISDYNKKNIITIVDYVLLICSIFSIIFNNLIGICICIIYYSHRIYLNSSKHSYLSKENEIDKWLAFKKYLNEFSLINERNMKEVKLWNKYLIYGLAIGVNKKVIKEYIKLSNIKLINDFILDKCYRENIEY